jgi:hypothetical protein
MHALRPNSLEAAQHFQMRFTAGYRVCLEETPQLCDAALRVLGKVSRALFQLFLIQEIYQQLCKEDILLVELRLFVAQANVQFVKNIFVACM